MKKLELDVTFPFWVAYVANLQIIRWAPVQLAVSAIFPAAGVFLCYVWFTERHVPGLTDVLVLIGCFFFTPLILVVTLFLTRLKNPLIRGPFRFVFDDAGVHAESAAFNLSFKWPAIRRVRESGAFVFFFVTPSRAQSIPVAQLRQAGILEEVRDLARAKVENTKLRSAVHTS